MNQPSCATTYLTKLAAEQQPRIVKLNERVYVAVDYDVSTQTLIIGDDGVVIVDTGSDPSIVAPALAAFRKITAKPIKGIIYTHGHPDHVNGAPAFVAEGGNIQIWGRENFNSENRIYIDAGLLPIFKARGGRQAGMMLPPEKRISNGVAPIRYSKSGGFDASIKPVTPTHFLGEEMAQVNVISVPIELYATPGETADQLAVWLPEDKVLCCGDNVYRSFPNLYPVRGSAYRDVRAWLESVEKLRPFPAEHLVIGHGMPFIGAEEVKTVLANYSEAISHVFHKTLEGINQGLTPDQLVEVVVLPPHLAGLSYLKETYGNVAWSVRAIFAGYMGWFNGDPATMNPLPQAETAAHMADLAGGRAALEAKTREALAKGNNQWAAVLATHLMVLEPQNTEYKNLKADALDGVAEAILSATGRNYTATFAHQLRQN